MIFSTIFKYSLWRETYLFIINSRIVRFIKSDRPFSIKSWSAKQISINFWDNIDVCFKIYRHSNDYQLFINNYQRSKLGFNLFLWAENKVPNNSNCVIIYSLIFQRVLRSVQHFSVFIESKLSTWTEYQTGIFR
jgi:hypothetical protein